MAHEDFNIRQNNNDRRLRRGAVYIICTLIIILTVLLDIYFITELLSE